MLSPCSDVKLCSGDHWSAFTRREPHPHSNSHTGEPSSSSLSVSNVPSGSTSHFSCLRRRHRLSLCLFDCVWMVSVIGLGRLCRSPGCNVHVLQVTLQKPFCQLPHGGHAAVTVNYPPFLLLTFLFFFFCPHSSPKHSHRVIIFHKFGRMVRRPDAVSEAKLFNCVRRG